MAIYLVTGVAGFIASKVAEFLLADGHTVVGVDNLNDYYDVRLKDYRLSRLLGAETWVPGASPRKSVYARNSQLSTLSSGRFTFRFLDIENLPDLEKLFQEFQFAAVFNLAARAGVRASMENPAIYRSTNILGEKNVLKCQVNYGVRKHVLASSSSVYAGCPMPFTEDAVLGKMQSPYAETKRAAELLARDYHEKHAFDVTVLRYFTVFGPAGRPDMAPFRFIKWIDEGTPITLYGDGTQARDFTYVDDIARGTILAGKLRGYDAVRQHGDGMTAGHTPDAGLAAGGVAVGGNPEGVSGYNIINLGGGRNPMSLQIVINLIEQALGKMVQISGQPSHFADVKETWADITKAKRLLGWSASVTPEAGFRKAVDWHIANREWLADIKV